MSRNAEYEFTSEQASTSTTTCHESVSTEEIIPSMENYETIGVEILPSAKPISDYRYSTVAAEFSSITKKEEELRFDNETAEKLLRMEMEIERLKLENMLLNTQPFGFYRIINDDNACVHYTGLHLSAFNVICTMCTNPNVMFKYYSGKAVRKLSFIDQILLTIVKLRQNFTYDDLKFRFGVSKGTITNIMNTIVLVLHSVIFVQTVNKLPSQKKNKMSLPACFSNFQNCRVILDCTEIQCQIPKNMEHQRLTYSSYKHRNTFKILIGGAPNGTLTYCSNLYPGSVSDKMIVKHCGILTQLERGDLVLADKGFLISDILPQGVSLNIPPFLYGPQFTPAEVDRTRRIAKARIHIERIIQRLKGYKILSFMPHSFFPIASEITQVCAALVNFQTPVIKAMESHFKISHSGESDN